MLRNASALALLLSLAGCPTSSPPLDGSCKVNADCPNNGLCYQDRCRNPCASNTDCPLGGEQCHLGFCLPNASDAGPDSDGAVIITFRDVGVVEGGADGPLPDTLRPDTQPTDPFCQGADRVVAARLTSAPAGATVHGGTFSAEGWQVKSTSDQIYWALAQSVSSGSLEFEARGFHANVAGCLAGVCYYVGVFEESNGDKLGDYSGSAFIESRYHTNDQENFHDTFKIQSGTGATDMSEPMINPGTLNWSANEWHDFRIEWGNGKAHLYLDGTRRLTSSYNARPSIPFAHLFLGTTNYKGLNWAPVNVTFRNLCLRKN